MDLIGGLVTLLIIAIFAALIIKIIRSSFK
jgi:hypothetical protein